MKKEKKRKSKMKFKKGDLVRLRSDMNPVGEDTLTGKAYELLGAEHTGWGEIILLVDEECECWHSADFYELVSIPVTRERRVNNDVHVEPQHPTELINQLKNSDIKFICVTGKSRAGKDTFVSAIESESVTVEHFRYGDTMKDIASTLYEGFPSAEQAIDWSSEQRSEKLWNGMDMVEVLIKCIDPLRGANPYAFITPQLERMCDLLQGHAIATGIIKPSDITIIVSGCRTKRGLQIMKDLGSTFIRIERPDLVSPESATMDEVQVEWPVDYTVQNTSLEHLQVQAKYLYSKITQVAERVPLGIADLRVPE